MISLVSGCRWFLEMILGIRFFIQLYDVVRFLGGILVFYIG